MSLKSNNDFSTVDRLCRENTNLAWHFARKYQHTLGEHEAVSTAFHGLHMAAKEWNQSIRFGSFASLRIKWELNSVYHKTRAACRGRQFAHTPIDSKIKDGEITLAEFIPDENAVDPSERHESSHDAQRMLEALAAIAPERRQIMFAIFQLDGGEWRSHKQIGAQFGMTGERVRQIKVEVLDYLSRVRARRDAPVGREIRVKMRGGKFIHAA